MSEEIDNEVDLVEDEIELEEVAQKTGDVLHDEETQALMDAEGLVSEMAQEEELQEVFVEQDQLMSLIESLLFASPKPISFDVIKQVFKGTNVKTKDLRRALQEYAGSLANAQRGVYLEEVAGGYQIRTKLDNVDFLKNSTKQRPFKVSGPSMETLAIIAYKQPCIKAEVDSIRGVESGHLIRVLMDKGLVQFEGKSDLPGKPMLYKTTKKFLEVFGLRNIRELPSLEEIEQLIPEGITPAEDKKTLDQLTGELSLDYALRDMEAEEELNKISDKLGEIKTTSEYFEQEKVRQRDQRDKDRADDIRERLLLGQYVEDNDMSWLKRYEQKKEQEAQLAAEAASQSTSAAEAATQSTSAAEDSSIEQESAHSVSAEQVAADTLVTEVIVTEEIISIEELAASVDVSETTIDFSDENVKLNSDEQSIKGEITSENVGQVAEKLSGLAGSALDAFKAFDDEEDDKSKNKIDI